jgi:hypothetical protein
MHLGFADFDVGELGGSLFQNGGWTSLQGARVVKAIDG